MPSFKERFRPSRKFKKNKDGTTTNTDDTTTSILASGSSTYSTNHASTTNTSSTLIPTATVSATTIDEHTGSAALASYHSNYSIDQCECARERDRAMSIQRRFGFFLVEKERSDRMRFHQRLIGLTKEERERGGKRIYN